MRRRADDHVRSDDAARRLRAQVALPDVQDVGAGQRGDVGAIVHRQQRSVGVDHPAEVGEDREFLTRLEDAEARFPRRALVPELHDADPAGERRVDEVEQVAALPPRIRAQIEPGRVEAAKSSVRGAEPDGRGAGPDGVGSCPRGEVTATRLTTHAGSGRMVVGENTRESWVAGAESADRFR